MAKEKTGVESGTASREFLARKRGTVTEDDLTEGEKRRAGIDVVDEDE